ncbi:MAG: hypothetical protein E7434_04470 [Ruminococcaceae bacterium]|nr:hypothetical protein [Oscillospiraceae bacterium]
MAAFNLAEAIGLKKMSNLDTAELCEISIDLIDPNPNNFFKVEDDITDLCESIKLAGLLQPPVVAPAENGRYRLIAGHRRHKAIKTLAAEQPEKYKSITCRIVRPKSPELEELMLIKTNTDSREIGYADRIEAVKRVEKILMEMQKNGVELPGKMRSHVAKLIKASESQIARAKFIDKNLIDPLKGKTSISDNAAYKLAHLPESQQQELYEHYEKNLWMIDGARIQDYLDNIAAGKKPFQKTPSALRSCYKRKLGDGSYAECGHGDIIKARKEKQLPEHQKCGFYTCCGVCEHRFDCEEVCAIIRKETDDYKKTDTYRICYALRCTRERKGLSIEEVAKTLGVSISQTQQYESTFTHSVHSLKKLCNMYDVTPNEILGFEKAGGISAQAEWILSDQIGDLPDGFYFMLYLYSKPYVCDDGKPLLQTRMVLRRDGQWLLIPSGNPWNRMSGDENLVAVLPAPPIPEGYSLMFYTFEMIAEELEIVAEMDGGDQNEYERL